MKQRTHHGGCRGSRSFRKVAAGGVGTGTRRPNVDFPHTYMGVSINRGGPPKWMVYNMENPIKHGMIWRYHYFWKHPHGTHFWKGVKLDGNMSQVIQAVTKLDPRSLEVTKTNLSKRSRELTQPSQNRSRKRRIARSWVIFEGFSLIKIALFGVS